ncbi:MAG: ABC transporter ATP-binding protein, partial [Ruminococcus flavefaciens]|nr:ABC transporter ATP-binding protein [Ruminococcus flavefaciens]
GTTVMIVTHDAKVAAKCTRVLFLVDGSIKGEYNINRKIPLRERERDLNNWLLEMGW